MKINITATVESISQAEKLLAAGVDTLYFGGKTFGLRLPYNFSLEEQQALTELSHQFGKKVTVAVNGLMHPDKMKQLPAYLKFLEEIKADAVAVGDAGVVHVIRRDKFRLPFIYDGHTMVTSARQMNFWYKRGAIGSVVAREVPYLELKEMKNKLLGFGEILVYGATCIHQSKRPLLENYFNFVKTEGKDTTKESDLFLSEPKKADSHYSIYEDEHGTHIFATNDLNLMEHLDKLVDLNFLHWKLEGIYTPGDDFVEIAKQFVEAREALEQGRWNEGLARELSENVSSFHPDKRELDTGFFLLSPEEVK